MMRYTPSPGLLLRPKDPKPKTENPKPITMRQCGWPVPESAHCVMQANNNDDPLFPLISHHDSVVVGDDTAAVFVPLEVKKNTWVLPCMGGCSEDTGDSESIGACSPGGSALMTGIELIRSGQGASGDTDDASRASAGVDL